MGRWKRAKVAHGDDFWKVWNDETKQYEVGKIQRLGRFLFGGFPKKAKSKEGGMSPEEATAWKEDLRREHKRRTGG